MKNKIMTKALAVVLSASMALSLSSAMSLTTAEAATAPAFATAKFKVQEGQSKNFKLNAKSRKAGWKIVSQSVAKKTKVTAKINSTKKSIKITGAENYEWPSETSTQAGTKIKIRVRKNGKKTTDQVLTYKAYLKRANAAEAKVKIASAVQTTPTEAVVTLAAAATSDITIDTFKITEGDKEYQATAVTLSADKTTVTVSYPFAESNETTTYTYKFTDANLDGSAEITTGSYAVASIALEDQSVEAGSLQPIKFQLLASNGVDVTNYNNYLADTICELVDGSWEDANTSSSNFKIQFASAGDSAKVKVTYDTDKAVAEATVTAVAPTATAAVGRFISNTYQQWMTDSNIETIDLYADDDEKTYYFYAKAEDAKKALGFYAVEYSSVEVTSSNENVVSVGYDLNEAGKLVTLSITPAAVGSAVITVVGTEIKGSSELKSEAFKLNVKVSDFNNNAKTVVSTENSLTMTNAVEYNYQKTFRLETDNSNGVPVDASYTLTVIDSKGNEVSNPTINWTDTSASAVTGASERKKTGDDRPEFSVQAQNAKAGTYRIKIVADGENGSNTITLTKYITIKVNDVLQKISTDVAKVASPTWKIEGDTALKLDDWWSDMFAEYKLAAYIGGQFAGYLNQDGTIGDYWNVDITDTTKKTRTAEALGVEIGTAHSTASGVSSNTYAYVTKGTNYYQYVPETMSDGNVVPVFDIAGEVIAKSKVLRSDSNSGLTVSGNTTLGTTGVDSRINTGNTATIFVEAIDSYHPLFFGNGNAKNEYIAGTGTYVLTWYNNALGDKAEAKYTTAAGVTVNAKKLASVNINVSQNITMPDKIDYSLSASASEPYATTPYDLFTEAGSSVLYYAGRMNGSTTDVYKRGGTDMFQNPYGTAKSFIGVDKFSGYFWLQYAMDTAAPAQGDTVYAIEYSGLNKGEYLTSGLTTAESWGYGRWNGINMHYVVENTQKIAE